MSLYAYNENIIFCSASQETGKDWIFVMNDKCFESIQEICAKGEDLAEAECYEQAIAEYEKALELVPEPKYDFEASVWIYAAIGDAYYFMEEYGKALDAFMQARKCYGGLESSFVLLRTGECFFELEQYDKAREALIGTFMLEGEEIFESEDEKYLMAIADLVQ